MARLQDVILRGLTADKPLATSVAPGTLYYSTDLFTTERSDGTTWQSYTDAGGGIHAPTHNSGGLDPVSITLLDGFPGTTTDFLRGDAAFVPVPTPAMVGSIEMMIDGGASVITPGLKGYLHIPFGYTILNVTLLADVSGSIVIDIWKTPYASFPPTVANTITAAAKPTITAAIKSQDFALTGWDTALTLDDILAFNVDSVTTIKKVTISLTVLRLSF